MIDLVHFSYSRMFSCVRFLYRYAKVQKLFLQLTVFTLNNPLIYVNVKTEGDVQ